jgi:pre-rRNA-processing protein IPI3
LFSLASIQVHNSDTYSAEELGRDHSFFVDRSAHSGDAGTLQSRVAELEAEVTLLKDQLGKAKGVNDMMWETVVQRVLANGKSKSKENGTGTGGGDGEMDVGE